MPPLPQAPGFPPACPEFLWCPCDSWVVMAGLMTYALIATTLLLALALLIGLAGRRASWRELMPLLLAGLCALLAVLCARRLLQLDPQYGLGGHYTPAVAAAWNHRLAERFALRVGPLSVLAFAFALGVSLAIATLVRRALKHQ